MQKTSKEDKSSDKKMEDVDKDYHYRRRVVGGGTQPVFCSHGSVCPRRYRTYISPSVPNSYFCARTVTSNGYQMLIQSVVVFSSS